MSVLRIVALSFAFACLLTATARPFQNPSNINTGFGWESNFALDPAIANVFLLSAAGYSQVGVGASLSDAAPVGIVGFPIPSGEKGLCFDPTVAFDALGNAFVAYLAASGTGCSGTWDTTAAPISVTLSGFIATLAVGTPVPMPVPTGCHHDKPWIAADANAASPYKNNVYLVWSQYCGSTWNISAAVSTNHGVSWSSPMTISSTQTGGSAWPAHVRVGPTGTVYVAWRESGDPNSNSDKVYVAVSTNGGASFSAPALAFTLSPLSFSENSPPELPGINFWTLGELAVYILPDPNTPATLYLIANAPDSGDPAGVAYFSRSLNGGVSWSPPVSVGHTQGGIAQIFAIGDVDNGSNIVVDWLDNRSGAMDATGSYLFDMYAAISHDGGSTWTAPFKISDKQIRQPTPEPSATATSFPEPRIGEYSGLAAQSCVAYANWINIPTGFMQIFPICAPAVTDVTPAVGVAGGGTTVTLSGSNFQTLDPTTVTFGGAAASGVAVGTINPATLVSANLSVTAPSGASGTTVDIVASDYKGTSALNSGDTFSYFTPSQPFLRVQGGHCGPATIEATVYNVQGSPIPGAVLQFSYGSTRATIATDINGQATLTFPYNTYSGTVTVTNTSATGTPSSTTNIYFAPRIVCDPIEVISIDDLDDWDGLPASFSRFHPNPCYECPPDNFAWSLGDDGDFYSLVAHDVDPASRGAFATAPAVLSRDQARTLLRTSTHVALSSISGRSAFVVGPVVGFSTLVTAASRISLALPFNRAAVPPNDHLLVVQYDEKQKRWTDQGIATTATRGRQIRAVTRTAGLYTVLAVVPKHSVPNIDLEH